MTWPHLSLKPPTTFCPLGTEPTCCRPITKRFGNHGCSFLLLTLLARCSCCCSARWRLLSHVLLLVRWSCCRHAGGSYRTCCCWYAGPAVGTPAAPIARAVAGGLVPLSARRWLLSHVLLLVGWSRCRHAGGSYRTCCCWYAGPAVGTLVAPIARAVAGMLVPLSARRWLLSHVLLLGGLVPLSARWRLLSHVLLLIYAGPSDVAALHAGGSYRTCCCWYYGAVAWFDVPTSNVVA